MMKELELYVHLPFCVKKCQYCDFLSGAYPREMQEQYIEALKKEMGAAAREVADYQVTSVFFGGGTPSLLNGKQIAELMDALRNSFSIQRDAEVTMEGNPGTFTLENLKAYGEGGVNRLSMGCQSTKNEELKLLGRIHTFEDFLESFALAREAGFENINVDLMSGLPGQSFSGWEESLRQISALGPEHISAYSLIVEEGTPFAEMELELPEEDCERQMYEETEHILQEYGYEQYEISNYALPGRECRHNIGYWERKNYLGFGIGAASLLENVRFTNTPDMKEYFQWAKEPGKLRRERQVLDVEEQMEEFMFLGLRMNRGVSGTQFQREFGISMESVYGKVLEKYEALGLLLRLGDRVSLSRRGISVSNQIFTDFLLK